MYIFTTLEFSTHNLDFHLLTTSVNANIIISISDALLNVPFFFHAKFPSRPPNIVLMENLCSRCAKFVPMV